MKTALRIKKKVTKMKMIVLVKSKIRRERKNVTTTLSVVTTTS